ncbi:hypothetical protein J3R83DRAFT_11121 [Lanmaoa asiatica]|nr:hypothetical protein J3R83DRAFT_11121 [Lanmaoa asiatica]
MAALDLHSAIFTNEKGSDLPLHSAASFLHPAPEGDRSPTSQLFSSAAYQDLIQRQPTHPEWTDDGLEDHQTKVKLRRLHAINVTFEFLFGIWGTYTTLRYFLAVADGLGGTEHVCALVLGIISAFAVAFMIISVLMPLFPRRSHLRAWRCTRSLLRACYLLLLSAGALVNLVLVLMWHPSQPCSWDLDISWYTSSSNTVTSPCRAAPFAAWTAAATLRLVVTLTMALSFVYTLRSYYGTRHPTSEGNSPNYSPYFPSDPGDIPPDSTSPAPHLSKSIFRFTRSEDSNYTLNQSNATLPKSNSISTLAPSTSCTGHSRSHSTPPPKDILLPKISPPTSRRTSTHVANHGSSPTQFGPETPSQTQSVNAVTAPSWASHMLRRTSHISVAQVTPDTVPSDISSHLERFNGPTVARDPPEIRSCASWKPGQRGTGVHPDVRKAALAWENAHVRHASQASTDPESLSSPHNDDDVYSYGYGVSGPTYPYLDMYNPQRSGGYAETSSLCEDVDEHGFSQGYRRAIPGGPALPDIHSEPRSSLSREEESSGEEEEYVAMMGGFVRRMATIESLGSKEAAGTLSTTGSVALHSMRSGAPASQFSSVRFADYGSSCTSSSSVPPLSTEGSLSTAYLSFSSGGTGVRVNERGELLPGPNANRGTTGEPYDRHYYTASGSSLPRMDDGDL